MKIINLFLIGLVLFLIACAPKTQLPTGSTVRAPVDETDREITISEEDVKETTIKRKVKETTGDEIRILGKGGFEPKELTVNTGSTITFFNDDEKKLTLTFFKDGKFHQNSDIIQPEGKFELTFGEEGSYEYWSVDYGVKASITVE